MITSIDFGKIQIEINDAISEALDEIKSKSLSDYLLFLADAEYEAKYEGSKIITNPFLIDSREDRYKDHTRLTFLVNFLQTFYSFPPSNKQTDNNEQRLHMELMVYSHIWESTPFLRKLFRITKLVLGESYPWEVKVPEMGKHNYILKDIRNGLKKKPFKLSGVISKGFHTSLRNAFAHSEYSFDSTGKRIWLYNYKGKAWELREISFDEWSIRFCYSALLAYSLLDIIFKRRKGLIAEFGTDIFTIDHPSQKITIKKWWQCKKKTTYTTTPRKIKYRKEHDDFSFVQMP